MKVGKLTFLPLDVLGKQSISSDLDDDEAQGIYAYEFSDGTWYVGRSEDVRKRHPQHMHEYRHMKPPLNPKTMYWASVPGDEQTLDYAESEAIAWFESKGYSLRNVMKTGRPAGNTEVVVDTGVGWGISIPWQRKDIPSSTRKFTFTDDEKLKAKFEQLKEQKEYPQILRMLQTYVNSVIPSPADSAGLLWTITALPSTNNNSRLCTLSCNIVETLFIYKGESKDDSPGCFVNIKESENGFPQGWKKYRNRLAEGTYSRLPNNFVIDFKTLDEAERYLQDETMLDCCYRATAELMRRGTAAQKAKNNPYLTQAILSEN